MQATYIHCGLACWLAASAAAYGQARHAAPVSLELRSPLEQTAVDTIRTALSREVSPTFHDIPLSQVVAFYRSELGINIHIDRRALEYEGLDKDTPLTVSLSGVKFQSALDAMLEPSELKWCIRHQALVITTWAGVESYLETRVYPVRDLVRGKNSHGVVEDYRPLFDLIQSTVAPDTWDEVGGPGTLRALPNAGVLVCSQTYQTQEQIKSLITRLRDGRRAQRLDPSSSLATHRPAARLQRRYVHLSTSPWQLPHLHP